jgi:6-hydroxycyclohex-1-ene-1-carbonyl-CoA dehydrogenase
MQAQAYVLTAANKPLERRTIEIPAPQAHEVIVEVDACGLCHTDLGFAQGGVVPKKGLPIVLGHEVVGHVVVAGAGAEALVGQRVLIPAVMPCGDCAFCRAGRGNACPQQKMPGNDIDGGFATHMLVPSRPLVKIGELPASVDFRHLSVVADAVSTAYQAVRRANLKEGEAALIVGAGGVGGYAIQIAKALGAKVVAIDVSDAKLEMVTKYGADKTINATGRAPKDVRKDVQAITREWKVPSISQRILECSGTTDGQTLAYTLIGPASTMVLVGYTPRPVEVRLSNLMAFDATVHGTWGCPVEAYGDVLELIYGGKIALAPFVEFAPMSTVDKVFDDMTHHRLTKRVIFDPRA